MTLSINQEYNIELTRHTTEAPGVLIVSVTNDGSHSFFHLGSFVSEIRVPTEQKLLMANDLIALLSVPVVSHEVYNRIQEEGALLREKPSYLGGSMRGEIRKSEGEYYLILGGIAFNFPEEKAHRILNNLGMLLG